jgi:hypothetical protein
MPSPRNRNILKSPRMACTSYTTPGWPSFTLSRNPTEPLYSKSDFESLAQISTNVLADPELVAARALG